MDSTTPPPTRQNRASNTTAESTATAVQKPSVQRSSIAAGAPTLSKSETVLCGATAGVISRFVIAPLDVVKIRLQVSTPCNPGITGMNIKDASTAAMANQQQPKYRGMFAGMAMIVREEGIRGLWKGNMAAEYLYLTYSGIQFLVYQQTKVFLNKAAEMSAERSAALLPSTSKTGGIDAALSTPGVVIAVPLGVMAKLTGSSAIQSFIAGANAGIVATACTYPFDLLRTRFAIQRDVKVYTGIVQACRHIYRADGIAGFYRGMSPALIQVVPYMGIMFGSYDTLKRTVAWIKEKVKSESLDSPPLTDTLDAEWSTRSVSQFLLGLEDLLCGALSGVISKTGVYPLDMVRKRLQIHGSEQQKTTANIYSPSLVSKPTKPEKLPTSVWKCMVHIARNEGYLALYKGLLPGLVKAAPASAVTFLVFSQAVLNHSTKRQYYGGLNYPGILGIATTMATEGENSWKFAQCFGDKGEVEDITEADIISTVEFDHTGDYLATGDKGGRVVLFERNESKKGCEYKFHTEFQSHEPEFDYLKSLEIEEKINKIKWCKRQNSAHFLLSTNDKTVKLWKVFEKSIKVVAENNHGDGQHVPVAGAPLRLPKLTHHDTIVAAVPRKVYANAHAYHINSISINSDGETYISADDLRINLWNLNISDQSFNIVDIKPVNMEELTEVITAAEFHPVHCNLFMYSSSKGTIKLSDMRESALCDQHAKLFEEEEDPSNKSFFSEIISSISDVKFSKDGRYILSRDYLTLKVWDINMESRPVQTINIHDHLRNKLCDLYENDCIFDKFECNFSGDGNHVLTGSYNNNFYIYDRNGKNDVTLQADKSAFKAKRVGSAKNKMMPRVNNKNGKKEEVNVESIDFTKKILHASWHPNENSIAVAATNNLFIFTL
ncbi:protein phosphatase 2A regulatory subunit cdc55 [Mortierella claussenii]|nr:protein phosphatase 2A regulatory subunit cdc55 [Mortierella claussenii]